MLHARVIRPPAIGAKLIDVDATSIAQIPGARIVRVKDFLAVVAPREWDAVRAMRALQRALERGENTAGLRKPVRYRPQYPVARTETLRNVGDTAALFAQAPRVLTASYRWPIQSHASMGPSCAVADIRDGGGTCGPPRRARTATARPFAQLLGLDVARLRLIYMDGSGSYGGNGNDDVAFEAALISRELGHPVRVQWMREDDLGWDPKGPPQLLDLRARWMHRGEVFAVGNDCDGAAEHIRRRPAPPLLAAVAAGLVDGAGMSSGLTSLNADPPYRFAEHARRR